MIALYPVLQVLAQTGQRNKAQRQTSAHSREDEIRIPEMGELQVEKG
jgi:hypothetical protein